MASPIPVPCTGPLVPSTVKLVEDEALLEIVDPRTVVSDTGDEHLVLDLRRDLNGLVGGRILCGIRQQLHQDLTDSVCIHQGGRKAFRDLDRNGVGAEHLP
jgi:hypothetical protein